MTKIIFIPFFLISLVVSNHATSQDKFSSGPAIQNFGKHAKVILSQPLNRNSKFKVAFDVSERSGEDTINRRFDTLARFINMHVANGVPLENIELALVVHGKAGFDLLHSKAHKKHFSTDNPTAELVKELLANNVKIFLCGQSAAYYNIKNDELLTDVQMALSAMTANAQLSQQGFSHNPF